MPAVLRIKDAYASPKSAPADPIKDYLDRLVKLIPAEVVGVYLSGKAMIQAVYAKDTAAAEGAERARLLADQAPYWIGWTAFCFVALIWIRAWATSSRAEGVRPEWGAVAIAAISFLIWVYNFGDVFALYSSAWIPLLAALLVVAWTFAVPLIYRRTPGLAKTEPAGQPQFKSNAPFGGNVRGDPWAVATPTSGEATNLVLELVEPTPNPTDLVNQRYTGPRLVRLLLGQIQDAIKPRYGLKRLDLASGSDDEMTALGKKDYLMLGVWIAEKCRAEKAGQ